MREMPQALVTIERKSTPPPPRPQILIKVRGLVLSIHHEDVQAMKEETDLTKEEEPVRPPEIFKDQEMARHLFLTKEGNSETILECLVLTKNYMPYLINGLAMA